MIIIPELETIVILPPRTGTTAVKNAVLAKYPDAMMIYRHMEADGVPHAYDRWTKIGMFRDPIDRLYSLYKYCQQFSKHRPGEKFAAYKRAHEMATSVDFSTWLLTNDLPFNNQYDSADPRKTYPKYACLHSIPENRKSQFLYLRPDLGTEIWPFFDIEFFGKRLGVKLEKTNESGGAANPELTPEAMKHVQYWHAWDFRMLRLYESDWRYMKIARKTADHFPLVNP
jgi:hypothetical protein